MPFVTYPLNNILYQAEDAELFHCTRNSGIYANDDFSITITGNDNNVTIGSGIAWIRNSKFSGKVIANKSDTTLTLSIAPTNLSRYDVIAIRFDKQNNSTSIIVKEGSVSANPTVPTISRTESVYELYLYLIRRDSGDTVITSSKITDVRLNNAYCGLMSDSVTSIDTEAINSQVNSLISDLEEAIEGVEQGSTLMLTTTYDTDNDGVVDNAERLNGHADSYFAKQSDVSSLSSNVSAIQNAYASGVKGSSESSYRTGQVNITPDNVGAVPITRTVNGKALSSNITGLVNSDTASAKTLSMTLDGSTLIISYQ